MTTNKTEAPEQFRTVHGTARDLKDAIDGTLSLFGMKRVTTPVEPGTPNATLNEFLNDPATFEILEDTEFCLEEVGLPRPDLAEILRREARQYEATGQEQDISGSLQFIQEGLEAGARSIGLLLQAWNELEGNSRPTLSVPCAASGGEAA